MTVAVSIVSHGHGPMLNGLVEQLLGFDEVEQILLTINVPEDLDLKKSEKIELISNESPKGFGANHNAAFTHCRAEYFCVLNPDIEFTQNPFPDLLRSLQSDTSRIVAPAVLNPQGKIEDSVRRFPSIWSLLKRFAGFADAYQFSLDSAEFAPDWVAGMFMLFPAGFYKQLNGFDESYYMYCEDVDICQRSWVVGQGVLVNPQASVIHNARRASHKNLRHLRWHLRSMARFLFKSAVHN